MQSVRSGHFSAISWVLMCAHIHSINMLLCVELWRTSREEKIQTGITFCKYTRAKDRQKQVNRREERDSEGVECSEDSTQSWEKVEWDTHFLGLKGQKKKSPLRSGHVSWGYKGGEPVG